MDYQKLLRAYIDHIITREGTTFIDSIFWAMGTDLNAEEVTELERIADEVAKARRCSR